MLEGTSADLPVASQWWDIRPAGYDHVGGLHEFSNRAIHRSEATLVDDEMWALTRTDFGPLADLFEAAGEPLPEVLVTAVPTAGWSPDGFVQTAAPCTTLLEEGDVIDLGDRHFEVLHLPGHSGGSIGLFETASGVFFSGDAIYDGPLLDQFPDSDVDAYCTTMRRIRELPVTVVHGGHENDFGRERLIELCDAYLVARE